LQDLLQLSGRLADITESIALKLSPFLAGLLFFGMQQDWEKGESFWFKAIELE
jgi:hypothetical protein